MKRLSKCVCLLLLVIACNTTVFVIDKEILVCQTEQAGNLRDALPDKVP